MTELLKRNLGIANKQAQDILDKEFHSVRYSPLQNNTRELLTVLFEKVIEYNPDTESNPEHKKLRLNRHQLEKELQSLSSPYSLKNRIILLMNDMVRPMKHITLLISGLICFYFFIQGCRFYYLNVRFMQNKGIPFIVNHAPKIILQAGNKVAAFCNWCYLKKIQILLMYLFLNWFDLNRIPYGTTILRSCEFLKNQIFPIGVVDVVFDIFWKTIVELPLFIHDKLLLILQNLQCVSDRIIAENQSRTQKVVRDIFLRQLMN